MQRGFTEWVSFLHSPDEYLSNQRGLQDVEEVLGEDGFKLSLGWLRGMVGNDTRTDTWEIRRRFSVDDFSKLPFGGICFLVPWRIIFFLGGRQVEVFIVETCWFCQCFGVPKFEL